MRDRAKGRGELVACDLAGVQHFENADQPGQALIDVREVIAVLSEAMNPFGPLGSVAALVEVSIADTSKESLCGGHPIFLITWWDR